MYLLFKMRRMRVNIVTVTSTYPTNYLRHPYLATDLPDHKILLSITVLELGVRWLLECFTYASS